jgi:hypothetical protein
MPRPYTPSGLATGRTSVDAAGRRCEVVPLELSGASSNPSASPTPSAQNPQGSPPRPTQLPPRHTSLGTHTRHEGGVIASCPAGCAVTGDGRRRGRRLPTGPRPVRALTRDPTVRRGHAGGSGARFPPRLVDLSDLDRAASSARGLGRTGKPIGEMTKEELICALEGNAASARRSFRQRQGPDAHVESHEGRLPTVTALPVDADENLSVAEERWREALRASGWQVSSDT